MVPPKTRQCRRSTASSGGRSSTPSTSTWRDAGCSTSGATGGGFLRLLVDESGIGEGYGYDQASGAIDDARRLAGQRPLTFETAVTVPAGWDRFDAAFSHEVLYLLHDLASHAVALFHALEPGAPYFAVMGVHAGSRLMSAWHASVASDLALPKLYDLDEVADRKSVV